MTPNTFNIRFVIKNEKITDKGSVPVYAKIKINGKKLELSTNRQVNPKDWIIADEKVKANSNTNKDLNNHLEAFKTRIYQAYSTIIASNDNITAEALKRVFYGDKEEKQVNEVIKIAMEHNKHFESMIGIKYSNGSYKNYKTTLKYLIEFIPEFARKKDIPITLVNYKFCEAFFTFLTTKKDCHVNGANKQIQRIKKIVNFAIKSGYIDINPMAKYTIEFTPVNKIALTLDEIKSISNLDLKRQILQDVQDVFLFQCFTGLSYADVKNLRKENIYKADNGNLWIKKERQKTNTAFSLPLLQPALLILEKHQYDRKIDTPILHVYSNQKMNENLKLIQELAGINKNLTTHLARHTFATTITLSNGVPIETVSRMLGHTKLATTQIYAKVLDNKIANDMEGLSKILPQF